MFFQIRMVGVRREHRHRGSQRYFGSKQEVGFFDTPPKTNMNDTETTMNEDVSPMISSQKW